MAADCVSSFNLCFLSYPPVEVACILKRDIHGPPYLHLMKF